MTDVSWSRCGDDDCIRLGHLSTGALVEVRAGAATAGHLPPMAGHVRRDGDDLCFLPRFAFVGGTTYAVVVNGVTAAVLVRPRPDLVATTQVLEIRPSAGVVPRNLLRLYVRFSAPMSEGYAAEHVRLLDDDGVPLAGALLATEHELWDPDRRRVTVLLDPARIKRGLVGHREAGYPLRTGSSFRVVIDDGYRDARRAPLRTGAERRYEVGDDERRHVAPEDWTLTVPPTQTLEPFVVAFERPLDHGLLTRCLRVVGPDGRAVDGRVELGPEERSWQLSPAEAWATGTHELVVDPVLEDLAGNSVSRVFDRDRARAEDEPREVRPIAVPFAPADDGAKR
jgi:hypothetical protein